MARAAGLGAWWRDVDHAAGPGTLAASAQTGTEGDDHLRGRRGSDTIEGFGGNDVLSGRKGDDALDGGNGDDVLKGGAGDDDLYGGTEAQDGSQVGRDRLEGGVGNDRLLGGYEGDVLTGGLGKDFFTYTSLSDSPRDASDAIMDFEQGKDKLVFRDEFREQTNLHFIGFDEFSNVPGEVRLEVFDGENSSAIYLDIDGDGGVDSIIVFLGEITLQASDFSF